MLAKPPLLLMLAARPAFRLAPPAMQLPPPSGMPPDQSASMQFMVTNAMRAELLSLGYETREINRMVPGSAAAIINQQLRSPRAPRAPDPVVRSGSTYSSGPRSARGQESPGTAPGAAAPGAASAEAAAKAAWLARSQAGASSPFGAPSPQQMPPWQQPPPPQDWQRPIVPLGAPGGMPPPGGILTRTRTRTRTLTLTPTPTPTPTPTLTLTLTLPQVRRVAGSR